MLLHDPLGVHPIAFFEARKVLQKIVFGGGRVRSYLPWRRKNHRKIHTRNSKSSSELPVGFLIRFSGKKARIHSIFSKKFA